MSTMIDPMLGAFLVDSSAKNYQIERVAERLLGIDPASVERMSPSEKAWITAQLSKKVSDLLKSDNLTKLYTDIELPLETVLSRMESYGVKIDTDALLQLSKRFATELAQAEKEIYRLAGTEFNINSPKQLAEILFERLQLVPTKKTKTGHSTNMAVLEALSSKHPIAEKIITFRQFSKLKSTYVDALPSLINPTTGRLHTSYNQTVAATGRLSSTNPNLQNIPIRTPEGREIRKAFIAEEGFHLLSADYSQIELRLLAHFSEDKALQDAFLNDRDIHAHTASLIFQKPLEEVEPFQRRMAKTVNFGIIYGMSAFRLSNDLKIPRSEAKAFIDKYFETYASVRDFMSAIEQEAKDKGYLTTILGRRRYFKELNSANRVVAEAAKREAINYPLQGSAADIIKVAMINLHNLIEEKKLKSRMLLQVHDELIFEVADDESELVTKMVKQEMEQAIRLNIPVKVDVGIGKNWFEAH